MELTPRLQDVLSIIKNRGEINVKDLALELKVSQKTAKGYVRELSRLGLIESDEIGNIKIRSNEENREEEIYKLVQIHESEINSLKKEINELREELMKIKRKNKV
ncbi:HTH domain-containing protein [Acidianus brierleyi]|uniref:Winged helix-turn-helix domain-containing protein n=1 Tax=Acidianus brierleyi TaxID=41673 RepID=A0A2U9IE39_9CREN|nr:HTH domain-containing protein [Acidianus brierleyi]AWR94279.1 MarR family transcriptional regulator [Acidianus brierleyi]